MSINAPTLRPQSTWLFDFGKKPFRQRRSTETSQDLQTLISSREKRKILIATHRENLNLRGPIHVTLIACSAGKVDHSTSAKDLYTGKLFQKSKRFAEKHSDQYFILSALHGLLGPEQIISPYNYTLGQMNQRERTGWGTRIINDALWSIPANSRITLLAGNNYCEPIEAKLREKGFHITRPLKGLPIGKQLQELTRMTATP